MYYVILCNTGLNPLRKYKMDVFLSIPYLCVLIGIILKIALGAEWRVVWVRMHNLYRCVLLFVNADDVPENAQHSSCEEVTLRKCSAHSSSYLY